MHSAMTAVAFLFMLIIPCLVVQRAGNSDTGE